ncbi:hypothetical protein A3860_08480 [Niastella vici]|uniref:DUF4249 domain-containing protein n=1 Tax=Niastella vici TaxID=1703345 RepID=A0A1V9FH10_9BACT|nr:DUF4249 domain-containing protein [Niastella vici]OQP57658.1 hypothetical protein A3860_08480 [Niastella vici]
MLTRSFLLFILLLMVAGCTKETEIKLDKTEPLIVIDARISDLQGPYYVRVTRSTNEIASVPHWWKSSDDTALAVKGAQVIIWDDMGVSDTLKPSVYRNPPRFNYFMLNGKLDSFKQDYQNEFLTNDLGYYETTKMQGIAGHTYHLKVVVDNKEYQASAYMPFVPALDSAVLKGPIASASWDKYTLPFVYFKEPQQETNYYLLQHNNIGDYPHDNPYGSRVLSTRTPFYVIDDKTLPPYVNGQVVWETESTHNPFGYHQNYIMPGEAVQVRLSSLTKEAYDYYRVLTSQFEDDGNVYKPMPASAKGNFSNNALGLFYATSVSYKLILP